MLFIIIDTQATWDYWLENLSPYILPDEEKEEMGDWFDRWCDWMVGSSVIEGNDIDYMYPHTESAVRRLTEYKVPFEVAFECKHCGEVTRPWEVNNGICCEES